MKIRHLCKAMLAACLMVGGAAIAQPKEVKINFWAGPNHPGYADGYVPFFKKIEEETKGALKARVFLGGSLLDARGTVPGIRDGVVDGGFVVMSYHPAEFPNGTTFGDLAMVGTDPLSASAAATETVLLHCKPCDADFKKQNLVFLGAYSTSGYVIMSRTPINSMADFKGKKVRSFGGAIDRFLRDVGAVAVNIDSTAAYEGLSKATLDIVMLPFADLKTYSLWDVAPYVTMLSVGSFKANTTVGFNRDFWKGLTLEQRKIFLKNAPTTTIGPSLGYIKGDNQVMGDAKAKGVNIIQPSEAMKQQHLAFIAKDKSSIIEAAAKRGLKNPDAITNKYNELLVKYDKLFEGIRDNPEALYAVMRREVYDKLDPAKFSID